MRDLVQYCPQIKTEAEAACNEPLPPDVTLEVSKEDATVDSNPQRAHFVPPLASSDIPIVCASQEAAIWRQRIERWSRIVPADVEAVVLLHAAIGYAHQVEARLRNDAEAGR